MPSYSVSFHTLGCKLNQLETESIVQAFRAEGFDVVSWGSPADIYVVNTCTVTSMAEQKARREIRKVLRERPASCVIATGCYAQLDPEALAAVADDLDSSFSEGAGGLLDRRRVVVVSGDLKSALIDLPSFLNDSACASCDLPETLAAWLAGGNAGRADPFRFDAADFAFHSRASLKIQDGCDNVCSYCRVRLARGRSVSLSSSEVLARLRSLEERGYAEAVLTGINISRYRDADGVDISALIGLLLSGTDRIALRISSTEPDGVDERFAAAAADPRVRPHFHLSVQSGSAEVLKRMRRRYGPDKVREAAALLRRVKGDPFLACDIIAGFPGESDADFRSSAELCADIGFSWIHAFPFSPRPGTEAAGFSGRVPERETVRRVERLGDLAARGRDAYLSRWIGKDVAAVAEGRRGVADSSAGTFPALSENYLKLRVASEGPRPLPGSSLRCRIVGPSSDGHADAIAELQ